MTDDPPDKARPARAASVPQGRTRRLLHVGRAMGEMAVGAAAEGLSRLAQGERPDLSQMMLTPANARRLAERLSQMRGAVMKLGQMMSMDGTSLLPPQFAELLGGLRDQAHTMPSLQLAEVLEREYGPGWHQRFRRFSFAPIAAASIGQVHRAETHDGQVLALKIQYPGVRESIDSDVANVAMLMRMPGLVPAGIDTAPLLGHLRAQLHHETDYRAEARAATDYRARLGEDPVLMVPAVQPDHCTDHILALEFAAGVPIDRLAQGHEPQARRDQVAEALCRLAARELFEMQLVQTDPNFGNYLYDAPSGRIALLDFGATEAVAPERLAQLRELAGALRGDDRPRATRVAQGMGLFGSPVPPGDTAQTQGLVDLLMLAGEPLRHPGPYDFAASDLFSRAVEQGRAQFFGEGFSGTPPPDLMFLQRKFVGTFMLCARLRARVNLHEVFGHWL